MEFETVFRLEIIALLLQFILILILFFLNFDSFKKSFKISRKIWLYLFIILLIGSALRWEYKHTHNQGPYGDEAFHIQGAEKIRLSFQNDSVYIPHRGMVVEHGPVQYFPLPNAFFMFLFSFLFGSFEASGVFVSFLFGLLTIALMFFLACFLFKNEVIALFAALLASLFPLFVEFSNVPYDFMTSVFFTGLSILLMLLAVKLGSWKSYLLAGLVSVFAFMIRFENTFLLALLLFFILIREGDKKKVLCCFLIATLFYIPFLLYLSHPESPNLIKSAMNDYFGLKIPPLLEFSPSQMTLPGVLPVKLSHVQIFFQNFYFTWTYEAHFSFWILGLIGFVYLFRYNRSHFFFLSFWFLTSFLFYAWFNASERVCILDRFIFCYTPFILAGAAGMFYLFEKGWYFFRKSRRVVFLLLILLVLININFLIHSSGKFGFNEKYNHLASQGYMRGCVFEEVLGNTDKPGFLNAEIILVKDLVECSTDFIKGLKQSL